MHTKYKLNYANKYSIIIYRVKKEEGRNEFTRRD